MLYFDATITKVFEKGYKRERFFLKEFYLLYCSHIFLINFNIENPFFTVGLSKGASLMSG
jgi:hypothetical protein